VKDINNAIAACSVWT